MKSPDESIADKAVHVWHDDSGEGRNRWTMFRRGFTLAAMPTAATLHLFADSFYTLWVNGNYVDFGPVRFDPRHPCHDSREITTWLRPGTNAIAVLVHHFGCKTYKSVSARGGMIAWGKIRDAGSREIDLATGSGEWKACRSMAFDPDSPKMSFALPPQVIFDQGKEPRGWTEPDFDDHTWPAAVPLRRQDTWGPLSPRPIPFMSGRELPVAGIVNLFPLRSHEDIHSFKVPTPFHYDERKDEAHSSFIAFRTWMYSPVDQEVEAGLFWGEHWLNGEFLEVGGKHATATLRNEHRLRLRTGWNDFFGKVTAYDDDFSFYLALPKGRGLELSTERRTDSPYIFRHTPVQSCQEYERTLKDKPLPYAADDGLPEIGGWCDWPRHRAAGNPGRDTDLNEYGPGSGPLPPEHLAGRVFRQDEYPEGFAIEVDLGQTRLARPEIILRGVAGAVVDFAYSEQVRNGRVFLYHAHNYHASDRAYVATDRIVWSPLHPRGFRYLVVTVRHPRADVILESLRCLDASYPVAERGRFECSDGQFNAIWEMCRRTQTTDMEDAYVDCPGRERGMYGRDTIIQYHNNLAFFGDQALMRRCLELYAQGVLPDGRFRAVYPTDAPYSIADFALNLVEGFRDYHRNSGDLELIRRCWPELRRNLAWFHDLSDEDPRGLLDADWPRRRQEFSHYGGYHGDGSAPRSHMRLDGPSCAFTCSYMSALRAMVDMAEALSDPAIADDCRGRWHRLHSHVQDVFWDESREAFADHPDHETHSIQANALAILAGMGGNGNRKAVRRHLDLALRSIFVNGRDSTEGCLLSPHFAYYVLAALYELELPAVAERLIAEIWGTMLKSGVTTCLEYLDRGMRDSHCHAWSASPGYYLSKHVLGITFPDAPCLDRVVLRPLAERITAVAGVWPHPRGDLAIRWEMRNGRRSFDVQAPPGVTVTIAEEPA
jgi:hypothetical protein